MNNLCQFLKVNNMLSVKYQDKTRQIVHLSRLGKGWSSHEWPATKLTAWNVTSSGQTFTRCIPPGRVELTQKNADLKVF
jgi:hypothetical protein